MSNSGESGHGHGGEHPNLVVHIDNKPYHVEKNPMTGLELLHLASIDAQKYELYLEVRGAGDDQPIGDNESISLEHGMHFISAPRKINPGE